MLSVKCLLFYFIGQKTINKWSLGSHNMKQYSVLRQHDTKDSAP